jgi:hypothetical protein
MLVSPIVQSKKVPYTVESRALIKDKQKGDKYSLVWGGSWNGHTCPVDSLNTCFNQYYELRVRYNGDKDETYLEYSVIKVTGHDDDNQPEGDDLIAWSKAKDINPQGWVKWSVEYNEDGKIKVFAEDDSGSGKVEFKNATSKEYIDNPFFGLIVKTDTDDNTATRVKFDMFRLD